MIPGNDDSIRAIKLYAASIADAVLEGKAQSATITSKDEFVEEVAAEAAPQAAEAPPAEAPVAEAPAATEAPAAAEAPAEDAPKEAAAE